MPTDIKADLDRFVSLAQKHIAAGRTPEIQEMRRTRAMKLLGSLDAHLRRLERKDFVRMKREARREEIAGKKTFNARRRLEKKKLVS